MGSVAVAYRLSCPVAGGIFLDQGLNLCPLHWQAGSQPLEHRGSPSSLFLQSNQKRRPHSLSVFLFFFFNLCSLSRIYLDFLFQHFYCLSPAQFRFCSHHFVLSAEPYLGRELWVVHFKILETTLFQH